MKLEHWTLQQQQDDSDLSGGGKETPPSPPSEPPKDPPSSDSPTGSESPFKNPKLAGMTEEQIADQMEVLRRTVAEQGARMTKMSQTPPPAAPVETQTPFQVDSTKFFEDPGTATRKIVEDVVSSQLREIVNPLIADLKVQRSSSMIESLRGRLPDFDTHWPYIQDQLQAYRIPLEGANEDTIETLYYKSVGIAAAQGRMPGKVADSRPAPPQHPPSSQPIPKGEPTKPSRELTEGERRMMRQQGFKTEAEYLEWQEKFADEILAEEKK